MFNPPITGDKELDAFLSQLVLEGTNGGGTVDGVSANPNTGIISDSTGNIIGYIFRYLAVKYADDNVGTNMTDSPTNKQYYGVYNSDTSSEPSTPASYTWYQVTGGFGTTKFLFYQSVGGRKINLVVSTTAPASGWAIDPGTAIDIDVVTSGTNITVVDSFTSYFSPSVLQVTRQGSPLTPVLTGITPRLYASNASVLVPYVNAATDSDAAFTNNTWRIGNSPTTGLGDISYTNITFANPPTDAGMYALWDTPSAMAGTPATITVPVRFKNSLGIVSQASVSNIQLVFSDPGIQGVSGPTVDISGYTNFVQSIGGTFSPASTELIAVLANINSPTYSWVVSGTTIPTSNLDKITVVPLSSTTIINVTLTVNGSNLSAPIVKNLSMPVVYNGATGATGSAGRMSAFPTIYKWTTSSTPPTRPTTTSTYTWESGSFTAPATWFTSAPSDTTPGSYLWSITVPLNELATVTTSLVDWTITSNPIRGIAYNGTDGDAGSNGAATFVITRSANVSTAPTDAEVIDAIGRTPVAGDIVTVSYNNYNNATIYRYVTDWVLFTTYITGSLIVENTITSDKMVTNLLSTDNVLTRGLTVRDSSGNIILSSVNPLNYTNISPSSSWLNSNVSINSDGTLSNAGGGQVSIVGLGYTGDLEANKTFIDLFGKIQGVSSGANTAVVNSLVTINADGTLSNAGGGQVTASGINAVNVDLSNAPGGILNSNVSLGTLGAGGFAYLSQITSSNISTYIEGAAIGTAQVGVLTAGNIGALTIDASKIAGNTITGDKIAANTITADNINSNNLTIKDASGNTIFGAGTNLDYTRIIADSGWLNSNVSINADGTINNAGGGQVTIAGLDDTVIRSTNAITEANISTYINTGAISNAYIGNFIQSANYVPGATGWQIDKTGSADLNDAIFRGLLVVGSNPVISGTTMTGSGARIYSDGKFALGNSDTNITFNGSVLSLNGSVVSNGNIVDGAITSGKLAEAAVTATKLLDGIISAAKTDLAAISPLTGYLNPDTVDTSQIVNGAVSSLKVLDGAITAAKTDLAALDATTGNLKANTVNAAQLVADSVTSVKIAANAVTAAKTDIAAIDAVNGNLKADTVAAAQLVTDAVTSVKIAANAITEAKINTGAITETKIATDAVTSDKIVANAIVAGKISANAVTAAKIAADAVTADKIAANAVTAAKISADAVTADKISAGSITAVKIATDAVTADKIEANAITSAKIAADSIVSSKIAANAIIADNISANAITSAKIATDAVTADKIISNAITAVKISADAVTAEKIAADSVTAVKIAAGAIVADKIATNAITAIKIDADAITADKIAANAITAVKIAAGAVNADKIAADTVWTNYLRVGSTPVVSGTTMTGSGAVINAAGTFALGNATTNITFNNTQMSLNGNVVATGNLNLNAVTLTSSAFTSTGYVNTEANVWQDAQTITITTNGSQVYITASGSPIIGGYFDGFETYPDDYPVYRLVRDSTILMYGGRNPSMIYSDTPTAGTYTYRLQVITEVPVGALIIAYAGLSNRSLFAIETKR